MNKIVLLLGILFLAVSGLAKEITITIDQCGKISKTDYEKIKGKIFSAGTTALSFIMDGSMYSLEVKKEDLKEESPKIFTGPTLLPAPENLILGPVELSEPGTAYVVSIYRYKSNEELCNRKDAVLIFSRSFLTYHRYYLGLHLAALMPTSRASEYKLGFDKPDDVYPSIMETEIRNPYMLIYGSIYPWGFEPDVAIQDGFLKRVHFDLGFELTKNIFKNVHLGIGYNLFNYLSLNAFMSYGKVDVLREGFAPGLLSNEKIKEVPLDQEIELRFGVGFSVPVDFAITWLGRILNIK